MKDKVLKITKSVLLLLFGLMCAGFLIYRFVRFKGSPLLENTTGIPQIADPQPYKALYLTYFTYISSIVFIAWLLLYSLADLFNIKKLQAATHRDSIVSIVVCYEVITGLFYFGSELVFGPRQFGFTGTSPQALFGFFDNMLFHLIMPTVCVLVSIFNPHEEKVSFKKFYYSLVLPFVYFFVVLLVLNITMQGAWFPYQIFSGKAMYAMLKGSLVGYQTVYGVLLVAASIIALCVLIVLIYLLILHINNTMCARQNAKFKEDR